MSSQFMLGFIAGEGSFYISLYKRESSGFIRINPAFGLKVYEDDVLHMMQDELGIGSVSTYGKESQLRVQSVDECKILRGFVEGNAGEWFKSTDKWDQFQMWSRAIDILDGWDRDDPVSKDLQKELVDLSYDIPRTDTKNKSKEYWYDVIDSAKRYTCGEETSTGGRCEQPVSSEDAKCSWHS